MRAQAGRREAGPWGKGGDALHGVGGAQRVPEARLRGQGPRSVPARAGTLRPRLAYTRKPRAPAAGQRMNRPLSGLSSGANAVKGAALIP